MLDDENKEPKLENDKAGKDTNSLSIVYWNCEKRFGVSKTKQEIVKMEIMRENRSVVAIAEPTIDQNGIIPPMPGFKVAYNDKWRLIVYHKDKLQLKERKYDDVKVPMVVLEGRDTTLIFLYSEYSDPITKKKYSPKLRADNIINALQKALKDAKRKIHVMGDVNFNYDKTTESQCRKLKDFFRGHNFVMNKDGPTHKNYAKNRKDTLLDWYLTKNMIGNFYTIDHGKESDHKMIVWESEKHMTEKGKVISIEIWKYGDEAKQKALESDPRLLLIGNENMDTLIDQVQTYAHEVIDAGKKVIKREKWGTSWYSKELLEIKKELNKTKDPKRRIELTKVLKKETRRTKREYLRKEVGRKNHPYPQKDRCTIESLIITDKDGNIEKEIFEDKEMAEYLGREWHGAVKKITDKNEINITEVINRFKKRFEEGKDRENKDLHERKWRIRPPSSREETLRFIGTLKSKSSTGADRISIKLLKILSGFIVEHVYQILRLACNNGEFSKKLKPVHLVPVFKSGKSPHSWEGYRPVAMAIALGRIIDAWINKRITEKIEKLNIFQDSVHGYRKMRSCGTLIRDVVKTAQDIRKNKKGSNVLLLCIDYSKAYDVICTELCVEVMKALNCHESVADLLTNFLTEREMRVRIRESESSPNTPKYGILQGSSLSPTLFALITTDLVYEMRKVAEKMCTYADDSCAIIEYKTKAEGLKKAKIAAEVIDKWGKEVGLAINKKKTEYITISSRNKNIPTMNILGQDVVESDTLKLVGVHMDNTLNTWTKQLTELTRKLKTKIETMKLLGDGHSIKHRITLYKGLVQGTLLAGAEGFLPTMQKTTIQSLQEVMNLGIRGILHLPPKGDSDWEGNKISMTKYRKQLGLKSVQRMQEEMIERNVYKNWDNIEDFELIKKKANIKSITYVEAKVKQEKFKKLSQIVSFKKLKSIQRYEASKEQKEEPQIVNKITVKTNGKLRRKIIGTPKTPTSIKQLRRSARNNKKVITYQEYSSSDDE